MKLTESQKNVIRLMREGHILDADINNNNGDVSKRRINGQPLNRKTIEILYRAQIIDQYWELTDLGKSIEL